LFLKSPSTLGVTRPTIGRYQYSACAGSSEARPGLLLRPGLAIQLFHDMSLPIFTHRLLPQTGHAVDSSHIDPIPENAAKPFRLLDLPKEVRLMIHAELGR